MPVYLSSHPTTLVELTQRIFKVTPYSLVFVPVGLCKRLHSCHHLLLEASILLEGSIAGSIAQPLPQSFRFCLHACCRGTSSWLSVLKGYRTDAHALGPSLNLLGVRASQIWDPQISEIAVEIDGAAVAEGCAVIVKSDAVLDIGTAMKLVIRIGIIK